MAIEDIIPLDALFGGENTKKKKKKGRPYRIIFPNDANSKNGCARGTRPDRYRGEGAIRIAGPIGREFI